MKDTRTIQMLASVSLIGGPLSLIVGGVILSTAAFVCGIIAFVMIRSNRSAQDEAASDAILQTLTRQAIIGIVVSAIALVMNAATLIMLLPSIMDAVQTGDYSALFSGDAPSSDSSGSSGSGDAFGSGNGNEAANASQSSRSSVWG